MNLISFLSYSPGTRSLGCILKELMFSLLDLALLSLSYVALTADSNDVGL
jgi:hypothetical protein